MPKDVGSLTARSLIPPSHCQTPPIWNPCVDILWVFESYDSFHFEAFSWIWLYVTIRTTTAGLTYYNSKW